MSQPTLLPKPRPLPAPVLELCVHLEERRIRTSSHGEGLLDDLRIEPPRVPTAAAESDGAARFPTRSLLCDATPGDLLRALPGAVATAEAGLRITQATVFGPVDLIPSRPADDVGPPHAAASIDEALLAFGLGPLAIAWRPADESWSDPGGQLAAMRAGRFELATRTPNPFAIAPRRYWVAARLIAERALEVAPDVIEAAREAFPAISERLPQGAPARRELTRILAAPAPGSTNALAFLRASGVSGFLFPGTQEINEARLGALPACPAIRWAAWLRGSATGRALVRLRMPHALAKRIERVQATHPIERTMEPGRDLGLRKLLHRHDPEELAGLFAWRRIELAGAAAPPEANEIEQRLQKLEQRIEQTRAAASRTNLVRALAIDGETVMKRLDAGPGRHVGQALAHLARFIADAPEANEPERLEAELLVWARANTNLLD